MCRPRSKDRHRCQRKIYTLPGVIFNSCVSFQCFISPWDMGLILQCNVLAVWACTTHLHIAVEVKVVKTYEIPIAKITSMVSTLLGVNNSKIQVKKSLSRSDSFQRNMI